MASRILQKRGLAQAATAALQNSAAATQVAKADNGVTLVSVEPRVGQLATLAMVIKSGSRNESYDNQGISHAMRIVAGLGTKNFTSFSINRNIQQAGSILKCNQGREATVYSTQVLNNKVDDVIDYFLDAVGNQMFKPWEVSDNTFRMNLELENLDPATRAAELLHRAAYRNGLGNSLYSPQYMVGRHKPAALQSFYNKTFTAPRSALVGVGIDLKVLEKFSSLLNLETGAGPNDKAKYFGGEQRQDGAGSMAYIALAAETAGATSAKDLVTANLIRRILGNGGCMKWTQGNGKLDKAVGKDNSMYDFDGQGINFAYSDSGLLGIAFRADSKLAGKAIEAAASTLRSLSVSKEELAAAKKSLLVDLWGQINDQATMAENYGQQILHGQELMSNEKMADLAQNISLGDVQALAKKVSSGNLSMGAVGNLENIPYLDAL